MRSARSLPTLLALALALVSAPAALADDAGWEKLKSVVGTWTTTHEGKTTTVTYALVSNGTALMETMETPAPDNVQMVTMYHKDGDTLLMTHYCAMGNQPRMRARGLKDGKLDFQYLDAANTKGEDAPRMSRLVMSFPDADRLVNTWYHRTGGKEEPIDFTLTRKK